MGQSVHISATLNKKILERVNLFCQREERSKSWLISKAVDRLLNDWETETAYSQDEWTKMEKLSNQKGKVYLTANQAKQHLKNL